MCLYSIRLLNITFSVIENGIKGGGGYCTSERGDKRMSSHFTFLEYCLEQYSVHCFELGGAPMQET